MTQDGKTAPAAAGDSPRPSVGPLTDILDSRSSRGLVGAVAGAEVSREPFESFYRRELPRLTAFAHALCGAGSADDVAQEAMLVAFRRWDEVSGFASPEAWVRRVCANKATSVLRRRGSEARAVLRLATRPVADTPASPGEAFWAEVRRLPRRQAQAAALRYAYDMSLEDIAVVLECSTGSVKVHLSRARKALAQRLSLDEEATP